MTGAAERRDRLRAVYEQSLTCTECPLHRTRTKVVFGAGDADAGLMFVGEGPGANEDAQGLPFVGRAGALLQTLLEEIGLGRDQVFICNVVKCRPPGNRDPHPEEIDACHHYLRAQVELIEPRVICTLGNFATKLLRGDPTGISRLHGCPEVQVLGDRAVRLLPLYHPAAALYTPATLAILREDFARIPDLLSLDPAEVRGTSELREPAPEPEPAPEQAQSQPDVEMEPAQATAPPRQEQMNLF